jgi:hypothetical protein
LFTKFSKDYWKEGIRYFSDISPSNGLYVITSITIDTTSAKWCNNSITLKIYLQGIFLGTLFVDKKECECFSCPHPHSFTKSLNNFTAYNYGGMNSLRIDPGLKY